MPGDLTTKPESRFTLKSRLEELTRLWPWVEAWAENYALPANTVFAIQLCLEEVLSNVIRHGYGESSDQAITVECATVNGSVLFIIEDHAPAFNPLQSTDSESQAVIANDQLSVGGRGILLLRKFAGRLTYERLPSGNKLTMGFPLPA